MKRSALHIFTMVGMILCLTAISSSAQTASRFTGHIPFDFTMGEESYKAGDYTVDVTGADRTLLYIQNVKDRRGRFMITIPKVTDQAMGMSELVFNRYGDQYFLAQLLTPDFGAEFRSSHTERTLAKQRAEPKPQREAVALAIRRR